MAVPTVAAALAAAAILATVTNADLERAISIGRRPDAERARFHARYVVPLQDPTVERIEVLTEFRRAVTAVEERARLGDYMFGVRQLEAAMRPFHNRVTVSAHLRFHPQNALPGVPAYDLTVGDADDRPVALGPTTRSPVYAWGGADPSSGQALIGAIVEITFDAGIIGQAQRRVAVLLDGKRIAGTTIDFAALE